MTKLIIYHFVPRRDSHRLPFVLSPPLAIVMVSTHFENVFAVDFIAYLQVLIAVAVLLQFLLDEVTIPDDIHEMVMQTIEELGLPPLTGKQRGKKGAISFSNSPAKWPCIKYDYARAEASILSDWVGAVPRFPD